MQSPNKTYRTAKPDSLFRTANGKDFLEENGH